MVGKDVGMATLTGLLHLHSILSVMAKARQYLSSKLAITYSAGTPISHGAVSKVIMNNKERQSAGDKLIPIFSVFRLGRYILSSTKNTNCN